MAQGFQEIFDAQITTTSTGGPFQPGEVVVHRSGTGRGNFAMAKWVKVASGCSQGEVLVNDDGLTVDSSVRIASTTGVSDAFSPNFRGIAGATIASGSFGFMIFHGYVEKADLSRTAASGELLTTSASTAGKLTTHKASSFWGATLGVSSALGSAPFVFAIARTAIATGVGSVNICGTWG